MEDLWQEMPREECGVVAVVNHPEAAKLAYLGLYALQHRGQESAGIVSADDTRLYCHKGRGLVADVFDEPSLANLHGTAAIGHVRYSTTGSSVETNAQPILANYAGGALAVAHNGNITNSDELRRELQRRGAIFQTTTDTEILVHMVAQSGEAAFGDALFGSLGRLKGAYSMLVIRPGEVRAVKDPRGFRPLCFGKLDDAFVVASESCAFDIMGATYLRELAPGEAITFAGGTAHSSKPFPAEEQAFCVFEYVYFSRPDSMAQSRAVGEIRQRLGEQLAIEHPADAEVCIAVPDSSTPAAIGYARRSGIPYDIGLVRSHYVGRTFIEPEQAIRDFGARIKYNPVRGILQDRKVAVIDDSIVRGTTSRKIVNLIRGAGAKEVHMRICSPPWRNPCYFGIDTPEKDKLLAVQHPTVEEMREYVGADTLAFISTEGLLRAVPRTTSYCTACFTGEYPAGQHPATEFRKELHEAVQ